MNRAQRRQAAKMKTRTQTEKGTVNEEVFRQIISEQQATGRGLSGMQTAVRMQMQADDLVRSVIGNSAIFGEELKKAEERGFKEGFNRAGLDIIRCCYAGICIALHDEFGFGAERCYRAIKACDDKIKWALHHSELTEELIEKSGLAIDWNDPFDRVRRADDARKEGIK